MNAIKILLADAGRLLVRMLPGLTVLLVVMLLLRGFSGTLEASKLQTLTLLTSFLGAGEGLGGVIIHTLPLAIAAAVVTFAITARMITFESPMPFVAVALIILAGTSVGGVFRDTVARLTPTDDDNDTVVAQAEKKPPQPLVGQPADHSTNNLPIHIGLESNIDPPLLTRIGKSKSGVLFGGSLNKIDKPILAKLSAVTPLPKKLRSPLQRLREIDWFAQPNLDKKPPRVIEPLHVLPEISGLHGTPLKAVNQMLGYLVAYQPRLFLAAIIAGSWVGWSCRRRLEKLHEHVVEKSIEREDVLELRRAA